MPYFSRRTKISFGVIAVMMLGFFWARLWNLGGYIPKEFTDARIQGAMISQSIVNLSNQSTANLENINKLDNTNNFSQALELTEKVIQESRDIRSQAVDLSDQVSKMTRALSAIKSFEARQAALEAISSRLALISRLINYSDYLNQLLGELQARFSGKPGTGDHRVAAIILQINGEVTAINSFNNQATQAMNRFDRIVNSR